MAQRRWWTMCWRVLLAVAALQGGSGSWAAAAVASSGSADVSSKASLPPESFVAGGAMFQVDFGPGGFELPRSEVVGRLRTVAENVARFYGRFPVSRMRVVVLPVEGRHGVLQGTTWGDRDGFPAMVRLRIGSATTAGELSADWIMTHELIHTALSSLPDDESWLEEGLASYVEPLARTQAGEMSAGEMWAGMVKGMPNGEPQPGDRGLNNTHTWGRTYWGGALFCLMADVQIRRETHDRKGLRDGLQAVVAAGDTIDTEMPVEKVLKIADGATGTHVLEQMYGRWSESPVAVDLPQLWEELGIRDAHGIGDAQGNVLLSDDAPLSAIRIAISASVPASGKLSTGPSGVHVK